MNTFKEKKDYICNRAKELKACSGEYKKALKSETLDELIEVVRFNASWCQENDFLTDEKSIEIFGLSLSNLFNSGHRNSGDSNSGYRNDGAFCTDLNPKIRLFNMESEMTVKEWEQHPARNLMYNLDLTVFVQSEIMTEEEKKQNPKHETVGGYLKTTPYKESWGNFWGNLSESDKKHFTTLPNFDSDIFEDITGVNVNIA